MKKLAILIAAAALLMTVVPVFAGQPADKGFNDFGYNYQARLFNGTGLSWCMGKLGEDAEYCQNYMDPYADDKLIMKWSKAWDEARFHEGEWTCDAWEDNEWNGMFPGGSGETWHYKIVWVGPGGESSDCWRDDGSPIWGEFEIILSHGTYEEDGHMLHLWDIHALPSGYGGF